MDGTQRPLTRMPMRGHVSRSTVVGLVGPSVVFCLAATVAGFAAAAAAAAAPSCGEFTAVAAASGAQSFTSSPYLLTTVDGGAPTAQVHVDSVGQSIGHAGAPYSETVAGNAGVGGADATAVPVFAISSFPARPEASTSQPGLALRAKSSEFSSSAQAEAGGPASATTFGRSNTTATGSCDEHGTVSAKSVSEAQALSFEGVLAIAAIRAEASVVIDAQGTRHLASSFTADGATILGLPVRISDGAIVVPGSKIPWSSDPLAKALEDAGISLRIVGAAEDSKKDQALAPALEVTVARDLGGGTAPTTMTYSFGRAYARASRTADAEQVAPGSAESADIQPVPPSTASRSEALPPSRATARPIGLVNDVLDALRIRTVSMRKVYPVLVLGALMLAMSSILFRVGVKGRWR